MPATETTVYIVIAVYVDSLRAPYVFVTGDHDRAKRELAELRSWDDVDYATMHRDVV